jgi:serine/threonine protein kinase
MHHSFFKCIAAQLEDFEKVRVLGVGGTGIVYELLHKSNGQRYAMKEMEIKNKVNFTSLFYAFAKHTLVSNVILDL